MRHFYRAIRFRVTFLCLLVLIFSQGCFGGGSSDTQSKQPEESLVDLEENGGLERKFDELALLQVKEYNKNGKFSTSLKMDESCYKAYSRFSPGNESVTNFAVQGECTLVPEIVVKYMSRLLVVPTGTKPSKKIVEVQCRERSYPDSAFQDKFFIPRLVNGKFPECPPDKDGRRVLPTYRDHSLPRKRQVLINNAAVIQELDRISSQQVQEFTRTGQYSSVLSFNAGCGKYVSSLLDEGKTVINWIFPDYDCKPRLNQDSYSEIAQDGKYQYEFVSAVFAIENKQEGTTQLSRIVCESNAGNPYSFYTLRRPPGFVEQQLECLTGLSYLESGHQVKKILAKQYSPIPIR
jgi:hypothetical protein